MSWRRHPVDVFKEYLAEQGHVMEPDAEKEMRAYLDQPVCPHCGGTAYPYEKTPGLVCQCWNDD